MAQAKGVQEKASPKGRPGIDWRGEMAAQGSREGGMHHHCSSACPWGRSSVAGASAAVAAAAELPASALGHRGRQMCTHSAGRKTTFSCRNHISQVLISAQGPPCQTKKLFLYWLFSLRTEETLFRNWVNSVSLSISCLQHVAVFWTRQFCVAELSCEARRDIPCPGSRSRQPHCKHRDAK